MFPLPAGVALAALEMVATLEVGSFGVVLGLKPIDVAAVALDVDVADVALDVEVAMFVTAATEVEVAVVWWVDVVVCSPSPPPPPSPPLGQLVPRHLQTGEPASLVVQYVPGNRV